MNRRIPKHTIIISFDAVGSRDWSTLQELPHFKKFIDNSAYCKEVSSVYPSLTYPAHTSIVTGNYPNRHGIINNKLIQPKRETPDWFWKRKYVKGTTFYDEARKSGMKVAALLWPVTAGAKIHYNIPEILANRPWETQELVSFLNGSPIYELELLRNFGHLRDGVKQPALDNFTQQSLLHTLRKYKPGLTMVHFTDVDSNLHDYGIDAPEVKAAFLRHDTRLKEIIETLKSAEMYDDSAIIILGDHSQIAVKNVIYPNYLLKRKGYITLKNNKIQSWRAYAHNCDGSCYIYLKDKNDLELKAEIKKVLEEMKEQFPEAIEYIFTGEEAEAMGADGDCAFMLEAFEGWYFLAEYEELTTEVNMKSNKAHMMLGTHGFLPKKNNYNTFFAAKGVGIASDVEVKEMSLVDEGPTIAKLLGLELPDTDGKVIKELLGVK